MFQRIDKKKQQTIDGEYMVAFRIMSNLSMKETIWVETQVRK